MIRRIRTLALCILVLTLEAAPRRRAVRAPALTPAQSIPSVWLAANAHVLRTTDLVPDTSDLEPLRPLIGPAPIVALGDGTHGTHEFYTVKLRVIDFLVREMNFEVVAFEAPFPLVERIDDYIQGGPGNASALLDEMTPLTYFFWDAQEIVAVVEWMREYNAHRGERPAVHIAGFDVTQPDAASNAVVDYLRTVDPAAAVDAEQRYACARQSSLAINSNCQTIAIQIHDALAARQESTAAFAEALHHARVVVQSRWAHGANRDQSMAENVRWLREHRGTNGKMILWAHSAHLSEAAHPWTGSRPMGKWLADDLGADLFTITTLTAAGTYRQWTAAFDGFNRVFPPLDPTSYESKFREHGMPTLLIPFRKALPAWLTTPSRYHTAGVNGGPALTGPLPQQYDAAIFIDTTTAMRPN